MERISMDQVHELHDLAKRVYEFGENPPAREFDCAVGKLVEGWFQLICLLEERSVPSAKSKKAVAVEGLHEALRMVQAARLEIEWARRTRMWSYRGKQFDKREPVDNDWYVEGLLTLKRRFNEFMAEERSLRKTEEIVRGIVHKTLKMHFEDRLKFDPILVAPALDEFGDGDGSTYIRILIVYDGDQSQLDPEWMSGLIRRIRPQMIEKEIEEFPSPSFIEKNEWLNLMSRASTA